MVDASPFHQGEQRVQTELGVRDQIEPWARRVVRPQLPEQHRSFYAQLPFVVVAARDASSRPWATLLAGEPGFVSSPDSQTLRVGALPARGDALAGALSPGDDIGLLGIELDSRRRNRVNGSVGWSDGQEIVLSVEQAFGNCPQYITERNWYGGGVGHESATGVRSSALSASQRAWIRAADTFFVASGYRADGGDSPAFGMDASHRGGVPGFVRVVDDKHLVFPDYAGNNHFNTIGNLVMDPRIGVVFVDFERGDLLQLTGSAKLDWNSSAVATIPGARRLVAIEIEEVVEIRGALPIRWDSPRESIRTLRLVDRVRDSEDVTSFYFEARDGGPLAARQAGQYLPIELAIPGRSTSVARTYSLSNAPGDSRYRITVKRDPHGLVSRYLHDSAAVGDLFSSRAPRGEFVLHSSEGRPIVLVSAGVGVTPMVSMLHELAAGERTPPVWFVHGARDGAHHALRGEVDNIDAAVPAVRTHVAYSRARPDDVAGVDFDSAGRVDARLLERLVPGLQADFYLCGPVAFMGAVQGGLEARGVPGERIRSESFGPLA